MGSLIGGELQRANQPLSVIETNEDLVELARKQGIEVVHGNATRAEVLEAAGIQTATLLLLAIPHCFEAERILTHARRLNPGIRMIARAHSENEVAYLEQNGADVAVMGEREIARRMSELALAPARA